jgi:hypothetical protein
MNSPTLAPRKFKIEHEFNEYYYSVEYFHHNDMWAINVGNTQMYLCKNFVFDYFSDDTRLYKTPDEALAGWLDYMKTVHKKVVE